MDDLADACVRGDEVAREALEDTGRYLGIGIAGGLVNTFNLSWLSSGVRLGDAAGLCLTRLRRRFGQEGSLN